MDEINLLNVSFKDTNYLQLYGVFDYNVLDYFALSQFYDKSSLNEQIKMQARFNELQASQLDRRNMVGIEYDLWYFTIQPSFYVIRKQMRLSFEKVEIIALYYIIEGTIYQAPDLFLLLSNHVLTSLHFVEKAFAEIRDETRFHPARGYLWKYQEQVEAEQRLQRLKLIAPKFEEGLETNDDEMMLDQSNLVVMPPPESIQSHSAGSDDLFLPTSVEQAKVAYMFAVTIDGLIHDSLAFPSELTFASSTIADDDTRHTSLDGKSLKLIDTDDTIARKARKESREDLVTPISPAMSTYSSKRKRKSATITADGNLKRRKSQIPIK